MKSAEKSLLAGGRIIMIEPSNNYWSRLVYKLIGHEPFDTRQIEWKFESKDPLLDSNQALSWIIFERDYQKFKNLFPRFSLIQKKNMMPLLLEVVVKRELILFIIKGKRTAHRYFSVR